MKLKKALAAVLSAAMIITSLPAAAFAEEDVSLPAVVEEEQLDGEEEAHSHTFGAWNYDEENDVFVKECADCGETQQEEMPADVKALLDEIDADTAEDTLDAAVEDGFLTAAAAAYILSTVEAEEPATVADGGEINLEYDDYYTKVDFTDAEVTDETVTSNQVKVEKTESGYENTLGETKDEHVVEVTTDGELHAVGIGTATVTVGDTAYTVTVEPARLSLFLLGGQSNMEGAEGNKAQSIANENGTVYASYGRNALLVEENGASFIPSTLTGANRTVSVDEATNQSQSTLKGFPVYSLTEEGNGREGMDSAIAYAWHKETGDKVWVVNASHSGSNIASWQPNATDYNKTYTGTNDNYSSAVTMFRAAEEVYKAEIEAGHYELGNVGMFWHQGCSNSGNTAQQYTQLFTDMYKAFKGEFEISIDGEDVNLEFADIALVRRGYNTDACMKSSDLEMTGPRISQYWMGNNTGEYNGVDLSEINLVCNISDLWVYDEDNLPATVGKYDTVGEFFQSRYPNGKVNYPAQTTDDSWRTPTTPADVHDSIHYNQVGYNEIGLESARNAVKILNHEKTNDVSVSFVSKDGYKPLSENVTIGKNEPYKVVVPIVEPLYMAPYVSITDGTTEESFYTYTGNTEIAVSYKDNELGKVSLGKDKKTSYVKYLWKADTLSGNLENATDFDSAANAATLKTGSTEFAGKQTGTVYSLDENIVLSHDKNWSVEWKQDGMVKGMLLANEMKTTADSRYIWLNGSSVQVNVGATSNRYLQYGIKVSSESGIYKLVNTYNEETGKNTITLYKDGVEVGPLTTRYVNGSPTTDLDGSSKIDEPVVNEDGTNGLDMTFCQIGKDGTESFKMTGGIGYIQINEDGAINNATVQFTTDIADGKHATGAELSVAATAGEGNTVTYQWYKTNANGTKGTLIENATDASYTPTAGGYYVCVAKTTASPDYALSKIAYVSEAGHTTADIYLWDFTDGSLETKDNNNTLTPISNSDKLKLENGTYTSYEEYLNDEGNTAYRYVNSKIDEPIRLNYDKNWVVEYKADMGQIGSGMFLLSSSNTSGSNKNNYIWLNGGVKIGYALMQEGKTCYINYGKNISGFNASGKTQTVTIKNVYDETTDTRRINVYIDGVLGASNILANAGLGGNTELISSENQNLTYYDELTGMQKADFVFGYVGASGFSGIKDLDYLYINTDTAVSYDKAKDLMAEITTEANSYVVGSTDVKPIVVKADVANADTTTPAFTYQWYKDNVKLENETSSTLTPDVTTKGLSNYKCEVTYNGATVTTSAVKIKVTEENAPVDFEWNFNDFTNKTFTSTNGNTMQEVLYTDNQERLSNSNGRFVGKSVSATVNGATANVGAVAEMAQSFDLKMNENWTLEWKGSFTGGMILSGSKKSQSEGNYYIWKTGSILYVGVGAKTSAGDVTNYRNLGKVTVDSTEHVVQIRNYYDADTNQNTISILIDGIVATTDITTVGNTGGSGDLTATQLAYIKEHYFSPANTMTFQYMGVAPSFGVIGNIDYLKVYYSDPCKHANVSADWKYDKKAYWKVCEDCQTILEYTPYVEGETLIKHPAKTATCATDGNVAYSEYWVGGTKDNGGTVHYFYDDKGLTSEITDLTKTVLPMKGHKYGDWVVTVSEDGAYTLTHTCTVCGEDEDGHAETFAGTLDAIAVSGTYKTDYTVGDTVNTDGMVVKATFTYTDNGVEKTAVAEVSGFDATLDTTTAGTKNITVTYGDKETTAEVTVVKGAYPLTVTADQTSMRGKGTVTITVEGVPAGAKGKLDLVCDDATIEVTRTATEDGKEVFTASLPNTTKDYTFTVAEKDSTFIADNYEQAAEGADSCTVSVVHKRNTSGTSEPTYGVSTGKTENGKLTVDPANAAEGDKVTVTVKPDSGYQLDEITVKDKDGNTIKVKKQDDNEYTFTMPAGKVSVDATFVQKDTKDDDQKDNTETKNPFVDVKASDWFYGSVLKAYEEGWMSGTSAVTFAPNASTTRGMIVSVLYRLEDSPEAGECTFTDVKADAYYAKAVAWAAENGIVGGYGNGKFGPNDEITREQLAAILYRYAQFKGYDVSKKADLTAFSDYAQVSAYARDAVAWANAEGILSGTSATTLSPRDHATRAQVVAILARFTDAFQA